MANKSQIPSIAVKTLQGVFDQPKMNHRRDFLRENKLNLRELQKNTTHKLTQQKQEQDRRQHKHLQRYQKSQEQLVTRRSASQSRNVEINDDRQTRKVAGAPDGGVRPSFKRSYSQQRESRENLKPTNSYEQHAGDNGSCCCNQQQVPQQQNVQQHQHLQHHHHQPQMDYRERIPRSASNMSVLSKAESCDKEIQTEDINDEDFLYEALKKCSSSEVHQLNKQKTSNQIQNRDTSLTRSQTSLHTQKQFDQGLKSIHSSERGAIPYVYHDHYEDNKSQQDHLTQYTPRSQCSHGHNGHNHHDAVIVNDNVDEDLEQHFQNLKFDTNSMREQEQQSSARSRQTLCSTMSKRRTNGSVHKLGSRDDIRLPRYLEKEKREKEEDRLREMNKDPYCPTGHYALSEEERLQALQKAQKKMSSLINELNHMPMTSETLRLRQRKVEIEKELTQLELDIRTYSKPKVYVIEPPIEY